MTRRFQKHIRISEIDQINLDKIRKATDSFSENEAMRKAIVLAVERLKRQRQV